MEKMICQPKGDQPMNRFNGVPNLFVVNDTCSAQNIPEPRQPLRVIAFGCCIYLIELNRPNVIGVPLMF